MNPNEISEENKSFCILPWIHMYVDPKGDVFSCCVRNPEGPSLGNIHQEKPEEIWNGPKFRELRTDFLSGKKRPDNCASCYFQEQTNNLSHRNQFNQQFRDQQSVVSLTDPTGHLPKMKLHYWDFRFSNTCNLKCRSCGPDYSSSWRADGEELGWTSPKNEKQFDSYEFAMEQIPFVKAIYFAGGEPILMKEHFRILNELIRQDRTDVALSYNSNFSTLHFGKHSILELWKSFRRISISPSVDHIGVKGEYVRKGIHWDKFVENVNLVRHEIPWASIVPTVTVSIFNILDITDIHHNLMKLNVVKRGCPEDICFNLLRAPEFYNMAILPVELKRQAETKIHAYREELMKQWGTSVPAFDNILRALKEDLTSRIPEFLKITATLDRLRSENFYDTFPEYKVLLDHA